MYHWTLLEYGYEMTDANLKNFHIVKKIGGNDIGWTLGYMINQTNYLDAEYRPGSLLTKSQFIGLVVLAVFFIVAGLIVAFFSYRLSKQNSAY